MNSPYIPSLLLSLLVLSQNEYTLCERRISQEEWHQLRFGGMAMGSDPNQWAFPVMQNMEMPAQMIQASVSPQKKPSNTFETNIQDVEVGGDKLVLVNDQGSIKMLRASQLPTMTKQNVEVTTQAPQTVIQMPLEQYLTKGSDSNPTKNPNPMEIISQNYGSGHRGLPVAFATSSNQPDRPNVIYQTEGNNPCVKASDNPPIYIPAPQISATTPRSVGDKRMVRIIIEMPEAMTKNIDEASRYAATQVQRLKVSDDSGHISDKPRRKIKKNVQEVIRKVVQTEEDNDETEDESHVSEGSAIDEDMADEASNQTTENNSDQKYIILRKTRRLRGKSSQRQQNDLKAIDGYKKIIKVYRD